MMLKNKYHSILLLFFLMPMCWVACNVNNAVKSDGQIWKSELQEVFIKETEFKVVIDSLLKREKNCGYGSKDFMWWIIIGESQNGDTVITITKSSLYPSRYGYFYLDGYLFAVNGLFIDSLFELGENVKRLSGEYEVPAPEAHSLWVYSYDNGQMVLKDAQPFPCRK